MALVADGTEGNAVTATAPVMETDADMETLLTYVIEVMSTHMIREMATEYNDSTTKTGRRGHRITERDHSANPTHLTTISISCLHNEQFALVTFNCFWLKSSINYVTDLMRSADILFLSESWLLQSEIVTLSKEVLNPFYVTMKSSLKSDDLAVGRPFGGVGFVCRKRRDITNKLLVRQAARTRGHVPGLKGAHCIRSIYAI